MKNKKQRHIEVLRMPDPPNFKKLALDDEKEDQAEEFAKGQLQEELIEAVGNQLDQHFELTGEPITALLLTANHAAELIDLLSANNSNIKTVVVQSARQRHVEDEDEIFK